MHIRYYTDYNSCCSIITNTLCLTTNNNSNYSLLTILIFYNVHLQSYTKNIYITMF